MLKKTSYRTEQVGDEIKRKLAQLIKIKLNDPRLTAVTIVDVKMSKDLSQATVYFSLLEEKETIGAILNSASAFLRKHIAKTMQLRVVPQLNFVYDKTPVRAQRLSALIDQAIKEDSCHR